MASTIVKFRDVLTGRTLTLKLFADDGTIQNGAGGDTATDSNNDKIVEWTVTEAVAGQVFAEVLDGSALVWSGHMTIKDDTSTYWVNFEPQTIAQRVLTEQMAESYAANGVSPNLQQAMFAVHQMLMSFAISGTNWTVRRLDNSTTAFVVTMNDATNPTGVSRQ